MSNSNFMGWIGIVLGAIIIVLLAILIVKPFDKAFNTKDVVVTVTEKIVKNNGGSGKYLIFGEDESGTLRTFEITDNILRLRFNSSDVYAVIKTGGKYRFTVGGSRNRFLSWYPNIYEYELLE